MTYRAGSPWWPGLGLMTVCVECSLESCSTCEIPNEETLECCCGGAFYRPFGSTESKKGSPQNSMMDSLKEVLERNPVGRPALANDELSNPVKGGRLRAQREFPIEPGTKCEWAGLLKAGGGVRPIVGCLGGNATHRHHGPDKNTLENSRDNVHLVCNVCHNRWHTLNDSFYGVRPADGVAYLPFQKFEQHDRETKASTEDHFQNEVWWTTSRKKRKTKLPPSLLEQDAKDSLLTNQ